jgi:hypothetical protein
MNTLRHFITKSQIIKKSRETQLMVHLRTLCYKITQ